MNKPTKREATELAQRLTAIGGRVKSQTQRPHSPPASLLEGAQRLNFTIDSGKFPISPGLPHLQKWGGHVSPGLLLGLNAIGAGKLLALCPLPCVHKDGTTRDNLAIH